MYSLHKVCVFCFVFFLSGWILRERLRGREVRGETKKNKPWAHPGDYTATVGGSTAASLFASSPDTYVGNFRKRETVTKVRHDAANQNCDHHLWSFTNILEKAPAGPT